MSVSPAVFWNLVVLIAVALIAWLICENFDLSKPGPWWLYLLVVALTILSVLHRRNLFVYLYEGIRWLPRAIKTKRLQRALMRKWQGQIAAWDDAYEQQLMAEVIKQMDPKDVEELRKNGFL